MGRRTKRQSNSSYTFTQRQNVVLDDYGVSFGIITDTWLVSRDCLNTLIMMKSETDNVVCKTDVLGSGTYACYHRAGRRYVKDDMPHGHKSAREIHAYKPTA